MQKIPLGAIVKDAITGYVGAVTARCDYVDGPPRLQVETRVTTEGRPVEPQWFAEERLQVCPHPEAANDKSMTHTGAAK